MASKPRILLVEDDDAVRRVLASWLALHDIEALEAIDGLDGLAQARASRPDLVICDVMMPRLDGISMVRALRRSGDHHAAMPVLFVSGVVNSVPASELGPGEVRLMLKPVDMNRFLTEVTELLGLPA